MTNYEQGDVVLVYFVFSDESGAKRRPAVVISTRDYQQRRQEVIIAAISSNVDRLLVGDHLIAGWREAGLLFPYSSYRNNPHDQADNDREAAGINARG